MSDYKQTYIYKLDETSNLKVAIVRSIFNEAITAQLETGAMAGLEAGGFAKKDVSVFAVPGAMEIPLVVQWLFERGWDGVVVVGAVVRGETTHYETVCTNVEQGCSEVQLKFSRPVGFGVIMTENREQADARSGGSHGNKGFDAAQAMVRLLQIKRELKNNNKNQVTDLINNQYFLPREFYNEPSNYGE